MRLQPRKLQGLNDAFAEKWDDKYPNISKLWREDLATYDIF
jgi:transposase-like protein